MLKIERDKLPSLKFIKGVGEAREKILNALGIHTIEDLLFYFPYRYYDRTTVIPIVQAYRLIHSGSEEEVTFVGKIKSINKIQTSKRQILQIILSDGSANLKIIFFEGIHLFQKIFSVGLVVAFSGKVQSGLDGEPVLYHPTFDIIKDEEDFDFQNTGRIVPQYSLRGISQAKANAFGSHTLRKIIQNALSNYLALITETLPDYILRKFNLMSLIRAVKNLHNPENFDLLNKARYRMKFEEIFYYQMIAAINRKALKQLDESIKFTKVGENARYFIEKKLPFELTEDQKKVIREIYNDFKSGYPMNRLLQGDVGSGKTLVALITALIAVDNGFQVAIMAPTEILAFQHYNYFTNLLKDLPITIGLLTSSTPNSIRKKYSKMIENGELQILIGTHALIEDNVQFQNLGYVIIDEQHRFGVVQRAKLKMKGRNPHLLVMTATPIPRTLALTIYSDLDVSIIKTMPKNRKPIKTHVITPDKKPSLYDFIRKEIAKGNQAYIIYPLIEESEKIDLEDVISNFQKLKNEIFKEFNVGMIHGKLPSEEKEDIMNRFNAGEIQILVATSVIEVGIDNPNATIMVIEEAQRFGLSQLHQLRGRVGRSDKQSYCILISEIEVDDVRTKTLFDLNNQTSIARERLKAMKKYSDGFKIAEIDFKLRGPGDIFGTKQSGIPEFKFVDIFSDQELIERVRDFTFSLIEEDPDLAKPEHLIIKEVIKKKYSAREFLSTIA
ncbi:MAG: ATP-dependent DNA helicase RecG [Ignavibacteria bacterium]|nr:ATP-dependent DNA helicase RecG [Ignavibacteria bacterium]